MGPRLGGQITAHNVPVRLLITFAYNLKPYQLSGGPSWIATDRFDLEARAAGDPPIEQMRAMLQSLLAERFQLAIHPETRQVDGFVLTRARPDKLGLGMQPSTIDCSKSFAAETRCREGFFSAGHLKLVGLPVNHMVEIIGTTIGGPMVDETQLSGALDLDLQWSPESAPLPDLPGIFTAIQEQLGLKLQPKKVPTEVFVIDHVEHPTPN